MGADERQRGRVVALAVVSGLVLLGALTVVVVRGGHHHTPAREADGTTTSTTTSTPLTTAAAGELASSTTTSTTTTLAARSASTTSLVCRNSSDPACGPFHYDPPLPPDRVPTIHVAVDPLLPKAGDHVTFTVTIDDPDGKTPNWCAWLTPDENGADPVGSPSRDRQAADNGCIAAGTSVPMYGAWDPPPPFHIVVTFHATYVTSGTHVAQFDTYDFGSCGPRGCPPVMYRQDVGVG